MRCRPSSALDLEVRDGGAAAWSVSSDWRVGSLRSRPIGRLDRPAPRARPAAHERQVRALERAAADELLQAPVRLLRARDDEQPGRVAVEPVDDPRPLRVAAGGAVPDEARATSVPLVWPAPGCTTTPAGLSTTSRCSSSQAMRSGDVLGHELHLDALRRLELELLAARDAVALRACRPVDRDGAGGEQPLRLLARAELGQRGEHAVEALPGRVGRHPDAHGSRSRCRRQ